MKKNTNCMQTIYACFIGYIVQAIVNNFVPLLFVTFQNNYHISLERITFLITLNFIIQLFVDLLSAFSSLSSPSSAGEAISGGRPSTDSSSLFSAASL